MKKRITQFCIILAICGLTIGVWILFQTLIQVTTSRSDILFGTGIVIVSILCLLTIGVKHSKMIFHLICKHTKSRSDIPKIEYRIERYVLYWRNVSDSTEPQPTLITVNNRRGRRSDRPTEEKLRAIEKWNTISQGVDPVCLEEFLASEFGTTAGKLNVATGTFYYWRRKFSKQTIGKKSGRRK